MCPSKGVKNVIHASASMPYMPAFLKVSVVSLQVFLDGNFQCPDTERFIVGRRLHSQS